MVKLGFISAPGSSDSKICELGSTTCSFRTAPNNPAHMITSCFTYTHTPHWEWTPIYPFSQLYHFHESLCSSYFLSLLHLCFSWLLLLYLYCFLLLSSLCLTSLLFRRASHCVRELFIVTTSWCGLSSIQFLLTLQFPYRGISYYA